MGRVVKFQTRRRSGKRPPRRRRPLRRRRFQLPLLIVAVAVLGTIHLIQRTEPPSAVEPPPGARMIIGPPTRITDGDTFRIGATRIRLDGIDAPEMSTGDGEPARRHLAGLIGGRSVRCIDEGERSYERVVAVCYLDDQDLGAAMVRDGWARDWARYSGGRYAALEIAAALNSRGMH